MINIKAVETQIKNLQTGTKEYRYLMHPQLYSKLKTSKVLEEASLRSGIQRGALQAAWDAIGLVLKAWVTEGHSVAIPGLGTMRFALNGKAVTDVNKVAKDLIKTRKVIFVPSVDIKDMLMSTSVSIVCYDRNGQEVKRVQDDSSNETDASESENTGGSTTGGSTSGGGTTTGGDDNPDGIE